MNRLYTISEIQEFLQPLLKKSHAAGASLFGSYARGDARPESDLDVVIHGGSNFHTTDIFALAEDLHQISGKRVDVYEDSEIDPSSAFGKSIAPERLMLL